MKLHPRTMVMQAAEIQLATSVVEIVKTHNLTYAELQAILHSVAAQWTRSEIRQEREQDSPE